MKKSIKRILALVCGVVSAIALSVVTFASDTTVADMTTGFTAIQTTIMSAIGAIAPVALTIAGLFLAWRYGMKFFKSVSK